MSSLQSTTQILLPVSKTLEPTPFESLGKFLTNDKDLALSETFTPKTSDEDSLYLFDNDGYSKEAQGSVHNSLLSTNTSSNFSQGPETLRQDLTLEQYKSLPRIDLIDRSYSALSVVSPNIQKLNALSEISNDNKAQRDSRGFKVRTITRRTTGKASEETSIDRSVSYNHISPIFSQEGVNPLYFSFQNSNKTIIHHSSVRFSTAVATFPLPQYGRHKFSVLVEESNKAHPMLYIGVVSGNLKKRGLGYRPGWYFISTFSQEAYLNGLRSIEHSSFARKGQVISVSVDMNRKWIMFEIDGNKVMEGKMNCAEANNRDFYPCVCLGELGGRVSFV